MNKNLGCDIGWFILDMLLSKEWNGSVFNREHFVVVKIDTVLSSLILLPNSKFDNRIAGFRMAVL